MEWIRMNWIRRRADSGEVVIITPIYLDRILIKCPECGKGGIWAVPEGFKVAIDGLLVVTCPNGHEWGISGAYAEEKAKEEHG
jgi:hypothetical protein